MLRLLILLLPIVHALLLPGLATTAAPESRATRTTQGYEAARAGVEAVIERYFRGHATGDPEHMREAFLPTAHVEGIREGKFTSWTLDEYCALFHGEPAADENARTRTIDLIDVSGNAALAKATLVHGSTVFTDYFVLLKVGDEWRIANKVYYGITPSTLPERTP
jgi:hypothetical protein